MNPVLSISSIIKEVLDQLGNYGTMILDLLSIYLLWDKSSSFYYYIFGQIANFILNVFLKLFFQQARPDEDNGKFEVALSNRGKSMLFHDGLPVSTFGMPAEGGQFAVFSAVFTWLTLQKTNLLCVYAVAAVFVMIHAVILRLNTILQEVVGAIVGGLLAIAVFQVTTKQLKRQIREKKDDDAPPNVGFL
jgi:hypothetical protein